MPQYTACLASSMDGKIASCVPRAPEETMDIRIGSAEDLQHLIRLRTGFDAVLMGGATFRGYPKRHQSDDKNHRPIHVILTRGQNILRDLPSQSPLFQEAEPVVPIIIFVQQLPPKPLVLSNYPPHIEWIETGAQPEKQIQIIDETLASKGCQKVLVEGGGQIMSLFLDFQKLEDMYLTLCPLFLGGKETSCLLEGAGFSIKNAPRTRILDLKQVKNEVFFHLEFEYPKQMI